MVDTVIVGGVILLVLVVAAVAVVLALNAPQKEIGQSCTKAEECKGYTPNNKTDCKGGLCTGPDGKFAVKGACAVMPNPSERTSVCPEGHYCGRVPAECHPISTVVNQGEASMCAADLPESCGIEKGTEDIVNSDNSKGIRLKCDAFGYCQRPKGVVPEGRNCSSVDECVNTDGKMCCSLKDGTTQRTCQRKVQGAGDIWWCPDDPLYKAGSGAVGTFVSQAVSNATQPNAANTEGKSCGAFNNCATGLMCCPPVGGGATTCQTPLHRTGDPHSPKLNFCPSDPAALVPWPLSVPVGGKCSDNSQCKNWTLLGSHVPNAQGIKGTQCCGGTCKELVAGTFGIGSKCPP
jgi:hypothetical protein